jgi:hypothetical protein
MRCPECFDEKRIIDMRRHISIDPEVRPIDENNDSSRIHNVSFGRNQSDPLSSFDQDVGDRLRDLMNTPGANKQTKKEMEKYIKEYAAVAKKIPKVLDSDYKAVMSKGFGLISVDNIKL